MVRTLESASFLVRDPKTNRYHLGPALIATSYVSDVCAELVAIARPHLVDLAEKTGEATVLAVEVDGVAVRVDMVGTSRPSKPDFALGQIIDGTADACGKIFAAFGTRNELVKALEHRRSHLTPYTIVDPCRLVAELDQVVKEGLAFQREERAIGVCAVAVPVCNHLGKVVAALSIVVPSGRFRGEGESNFTRELRIVASALSASLDHSASGSWSARNNLCLSSR